ncbi:MAG: hypothetical protein Q7S24_02135 [bacterium]|nr:hypothetical protein [bacterium]
MVQKLNRLKVAEILKSTGLTVFTPTEFARAFKVSPNTASGFLKRNLKSGLFIKLRNKFYILQDAPPAPYIIANKLYQPSYISLETALSYYGMIPETVYTITSITTKTTREFTTPLAAFSYQRVKPKVFLGYTAINFKGNTILLAEPAKALADYLHFVDLKLVSLNERLLLKKVKRPELVAYAKLFNSPSLLELIVQIYADQKQSRPIY